MADVNDIVAYGFGSWSTVNSIPTLGFAIGAAAATHEITIDFTTSLSGEVDGTRKVVATLTPGDDAVVYVFEETEVS